MKYVVAVALIAAACGSSRPAVPGDATAPDDAVPRDAASDVVVADAVPADAPIDVPPDAMPDAGCPSAGTAQTISTSTPPLTDGMNIVGDGTTALEVWNVGGRVAWAQYDGGGLAAAGEAPPFDHSRLFAAGSRVVAWAVETINVFDSGVWTEYPFSSNLVGTSGPSFIGLHGVGLNGTEARIFDGTTVLGPTMIAPHNAAAVSGDGQGGFAVVTADASNPPIIQLALVTYDSVSWSGEAPIGTIDTSTSSARGMTLLPFNGSWALLFVLDDELNVMTESGGTWTRSRAPLQVPSIGSSQYVFAANGSMLAVLDNQGLAGIYTNGTWTQNVLTSTTTAEYSPAIRAFGNGFVAVHGGQVGLRAAVYDGTSWGSEVLLAPESATQFYNVAASADSAVVGFVEHTTTGDVPETRTFHNGSWGPATTVGSGQSRRHPAPVLAVEVDGIRTAYIEPGTAETMVENAGAWSTPEQPPSPPISGEVMGAAMAHAANGHTLLVWRQVVAEDIGVFAAEHDGTTWGQPILVATSEDRDPPAVAAAASTFIIGWGGSQSSNTSGHVARWTGTGIGPITGLTGAPLMASDGSSFVVLWHENHSLPSHTYWMSGTNGDTWSGATLFPTMPMVLTGGPAGVLALTMDSTGHIQPQLWHAGSWRVGNAVPEWWSPCHGAVGATTALAVCAGTSAQSTVTLAEYDGSAWTFPTLAVSVPFAYWSVLASDGDDYRFDISATSSTISAVLQGGTWSSFVVDPTGLPATVAPICGHWTGVVDPAVVTATGAAPYAIDHASDLSESASIVAGSDRLDAFWVGSTPISDGQAVLSAQLGL